MALGSADPAAVVVAEDLAVAGSEADAAVVGSVDPEAAIVPAVTAMGSSSEIAEIAAARAFTAICRSNGKAPTRTPNSSR